MRHFYILSLVLIIFILFGTSCRQKPVDAVYYGNWVSTTMEQYRYEDQQTQVIKGREWTELYKLSPPTLHLMDHRNFLQFKTTNQGVIITSDFGRWSTRNNNDLTLQTDEFIFHGQIVLLNGTLSIDGIEYPLDSNKRTIRQKAIKRKTTYRRANKHDLRSIKEPIKNFSTEYSRSFNSNNP